jgi:hypothetical protein
MKANSRKMNNEKSTKLALTQNQAIPGLAKGALLNRGCLARLVAIPVRGAVAGAGGITS